MLLLFVLGCYLTYVGLISSNWLGYVWVEEKPHADWWMNTYIVVPAKVAYQLYGVLSLWLGGLLTGAITAMVYHGKHPKLAIIFLFFAVFFSALGFNTLDWMLNRASGSNVEWTLWVYGLSNIKLNSWDFYLWTLIVPLFLGGFLIGATVLSLF